MISSEVYDIALRSIWVSGSATIIASLWSILLAYYTTKSSFLSKYLIPFFEALIGVPTVLIGLILYMLLSSSGPLGILGLLYTPYAIIIGEAVLITPLITSVCYRVFIKTWSTYGELALTLGASEKQMIAIVLREAFPGVISALVMGFSRAIGELGIALMVGGNIRGYTRVLTTAITLEVSRGEFEVAIILGLLLVFIVVATSFGLRMLKKVYNI